MTAPVLLESARVVWPDAHRLTVTRGRRPTADCLDYLVLPHVSSPRWLLPAGAPATAAALGGRQRRLERSASRLLGMLQHARAVDHLPVRRLRVEPGDGGSLVGALEAMIGQPVDVALRLGRWSDARSLVVRLFGRDGTTVAFGKVGIDDHARASVADEHAALSRVAGLGLSRVRHPAVLHRGEWRGLDVLLVSPLLPAAGDAPDSRLPYEAMEELAHAGSPRTASLAASGWATEARRRLADVRDADLARLLRHQLDRLEHAAGGVELPLGLWHGDWTPWNMSSDGGAVLLWDWEHCADDVPVGFDPAHFLAQRLRVRSGTGRSSEAAWRSEAEALLRGRTGLSPGQADAVIAAYLLEVNLRFVLDRQSTSERDRRREGWGLDLLGREVDRLRSRG